MRHNLFLITAASGSGKTSIMNIVKKLGDTEECVSHTTRPMRKGEKDGETYHYLHREAFENLRSNGEFVECVNYSGNLYGISKYEIEEKLDNHSAAYVIVEYNGYKQIKEAYPEAVGIFLHMSKEDCMVNMLLRGDTIEQANKRISTYYEEVSKRDEFDYVVKNLRGKMDLTAEIIYSIINQNIE